MTERKTEPKTETVNIFANKKKRVTYLTTVSKHGNTIKEIVLYIEFTRTEPRDIQVSHYVLFEKSQEESKHFSGQLS